MFKSKRRAIVTPQSEHLRLVGALAMIWGNDDFDSPPINRDSFVKGIGLHDRGYGLLDHFAIGSMKEAEWNEIARRSFEMQYADTIANTIVQYHIRRLASHAESPERKAMTAEFSERIARHLEQHHLSGNLFERIDRITDLCDSISFDFCMDVPATGSILIHPRNGSDEEIPIHYQMDDATIRVSPWPFSVTNYQGYLLAYQADGYPEKLEPVIRPYRVERG